MRDLRIAGCNGNVTKSMLSHKSPQALAQLEQAHGPEVGAKLVNGGAVVEGSRHDRAVLLAHRQVFEGAAHVRRRGDAHFDQPTHCLFLVFVHLGNDSHVIFPLEGCRVVPKAAFEQQSLARARWPDDADELTTADVQRDIVQYETSTIGNTKSVATN